MKKTIQTVALAIIALASNGSAENITLRLDSVSDLNSSTGSAFTGYGWFGNLGSATPSSYVGGPWTVADIASNFRSAYSFDVNSTLINDGGGQWSNDAVFLLPPSFNAGVCRLPPCLPSLPVFM